MGIFDIFTGAPAKNAANQNAALYQQYANQAGGALSSALEQAKGATNQGVAAYTPLSNLGSKYGAGSSLYLDALGVNGPDAMAKARSTYQASPGYQWSVDQATDAAARNAARLGLTSSGNTLQAISDRAQQVANQDYNNWLGNLGGLVSPELSATGAAASGVAGQYGNLANLFNQYGQNQANVFGNVASGTAQSNNQAAQAQMQGSGAFWNGLLNLGAAAGKALPGTQLGSMVGLGFV